MSKAAQPYLQPGLPSKPEQTTAQGRNNILGFWLFLGAETVLFGTLFAAFLTLRAGSQSEYAQGVELFQELISLPLVGLATFILLTSSLTSVLAVQAMRSHKVKVAANWLIVTVILGLGFLGLEIYEFVHYVSGNHGFTTSAFSSSFYALVGFHGAHVILGIVWISLVAGQLYYKGLTEVTAPKVYIASLYWHFVDVVWVFVFTVVYLMTTLI